MSMPESAAAAAATESAEGWNDVWDDDWDEEKAVKSPGGHSISANGLTSRNPKKDDWEDWDDQKFDTLEVGNLERRIGVCILKTTEKDVVVQIPIYSTMCLHIVWIFNRIIVKTVYGF